MGTQRKLKVALNAAIVLAAASSTFGKATNYYWGGTNGVGGNWSDQTWLISGTTSTTAIPGNTAGDGVNIGAVAASASTNAIVTLNGTAGSTGQIGALAVGELGGTGELDIATGASVTFPGVTNYFVGVGTSSVGTVNQTDGALTASANGPFLYIGGKNDPGSTFGTGTYNLSGGSLSVINASVGSAGGNGNFNVSGTAAFTSTTGNLFFGNVASSGSVGDFSLTGGTVQCLDLRFAGDAGTSSTATMSGGLLTASGSGLLAPTIGYSGTATFTQTGGTFGETGKVNSMTIANSAGSSGTYNLSGTGTVTAGGLNIGLSGAGTMTMGSGTTAKVTSLNLGFAAGATGTLTMTGGLFTTPTAGALPTTIGNSGTGTFAQTGGTFGESGNTAPLTLGAAAGSSGTYNLSGTGSTVTAGALTVGSNGTGTMTVGSGSTVAIGTGGIIIGGSAGGGGSGNGTLTMTGGHITVTSTSFSNNGVTYVGQNAAGNQPVFNLSGGTVDFSELVVGLRAAGGRFNIIGSAPTINANYFYNNNGTTAAYLDNGGVSTINAPAGSLLGGALKAGFVGGAALLANTTFTLIDCGSNTISNDYATFPDASMWTAGRVFPARQTYTLTLLTGPGHDNISPISATAASDTAFTATALGRFEIDGITPASPFSLYVGATAGSGKTLTDLANFFDTNTGIVATPVSPGGTDFNMKLTFATPSAATEFFGWDLSDFNSGAALSSAGIIATGPANLFFTGSAGNGNWDTGSTTNFTAGAGAVVFHANDNVTFDNTHNTTQFTVAVASGGVVPTSMTVTGATPYTFSGGNIGSGSTTSLTVASGSSMTFDRGGPSRVTLELGSLSNSGLIDLKNNTMLLHGADSTTAATVRGELVTGFNGGGWNGTSGIISSTAQSSPLYTLGEVLSGSNLTVAYTFFGDTDLSGAIDGTDYSAIDANNGSTSGTWQTGDFNYDGNVDGSDYSLIDNAFNTQSGNAVTAGQIAANSSEIAGGAAVPEPTSLGLLAVGAMGFMRRRHRKAL